MSRDSLSLLHNFIPTPFAQGFYQIVSLYASLSVLQNSAITDISTSTVAKICPVNYQHHQDGGRDVIETQAENL